MGLKDTHFAHCVLAIDAYTLARENMVDMHQDITSWRFELELELLPYNKKSIVKDELKLSRLQALQLVVGALQR